MLCETIKKQLLSKAEEMEIDVTQLESYKYYGAFNDHYHNPEPEEETWSEKEEWQAKLRKLASWINSSCLGEYVDLADDEDLDGQMTLEAEQWLLNLAE